MAKWGWCCGIASESPIMTPVSQAAQVHVLAVPLPIQLPASALGKQQKMAQGLESPHPHGRPGRSPWLHSGPALTLAAMQRVNEQMEELTVFPSLSATKFQINKPKKKKGK